MIPAVEYLNGCLVEETFYLLGVVLGEGTRANEWKAQGEQKIWLTIKNFLSTGTVNIGIGFPRMHGTPCHKDCPFKDRGHLEERP